MQVREVWEHSCAVVRNKYLIVENMCDLVSIMKAEGKNMEVFVMAAWLIWLRRNKLHTNEATQRCSKIALSDSSLLAEFQQGK